jgi:two-component system sensor histidine kinase AlgZ
LPDWRNFGVMLRVLLGINVLAMLAALVRAPALTDWAGQYIELAAMVEPLLLINLGLLSLLRDFCGACPACRAIAGHVAGQRRGVGAFYLYWRAGVARLRRRTACRAAGCLGNGVAARLF